MLPTMRYWLYTECWQTVIIRDGGSMHGTWVNDMRIPVEQDVVVNSGDVLTFGADVTRGAGGSINSPGIVGM